MKVSLIVAMDKNRVIGNNGDIPWRLPADWQYVKKITTGHPIVLGRKNFESIGRVLPNRRNIVLTRDEGFSFEGVEVAYSMEQVWDLCNDEEEIFIFGGEQIYKMFLNTGCVERMYITKINHSFEGDTFFPEVDLTQWIEVMAEKGVLDDKNVYEHEFFVYDKEDSSLTNEEMVMKPEFIDGKWYIEVQTEKFGKLLLVDKESVLSFPITFETEQEALGYLKKLN